MRRKFVVIHKYRIDEQRVQVLKNLQNGQDLKNSYQLPDWLVTILIIAASLISLPIKKKGIPCSLQQDFLKAGTLCNQNREDLSSPCDKSQSH